MPQVHRNGDSRSCGASTNASAHKNVYVNNQPISVDSDPNSHGGGELNAACKNVYVGNKLVVIVGNSASPDNKCPPLGGDHCNPKSTSGSPNVHIGQ